MEKIVAIPEFYKGKNVFITGGLGFIGKLIVEKLLRSCPEIGNIYLLARSKKDKNMDERLNEMISSPAFDLIREKNPDAFKKIVLIEGDVALDELGISEVDQELLCEKVSFVIHSAATISSNKPLKVAVNTNLKSVREMLKLSRKIKNLESCVHVSTAFTNWYQGDIKEQFYPVKHDPHKIIELVNTKSDEALKDLTPSLLGNHNNTYTFTKQLAENLVSKEAKGLPVAVFRPAIVLSSMKEPKPGWIDSWAGPTPFAYAAGTGIYRTMHTDSEILCNIAPADMVANMIISASYKTAFDHLKSGTALDSIPPIYTASSDSLNSVNWGVFFKTSIDLARKYPYNDVLLYPKVALRKNKLVNIIEAPLKNIIPSHLIDFATKLSGGKPRLAKFQKTLARNLAAVNFATTKPNKFHNDNFVKLQNSLSPSDQKEFYFDVRKIDWPKYLVDYNFGIRKYLVNQKTTDFAAGQRKIQRLKIVNYALIGFAVAASLFTLNKVGKTLLNTKMSDSN